MNIASIGVGAPTLPAQAGAATGDAQPSFGLALAGVVAPAQVSATAGQPAMPLLAPQPQFQAQVRAQAQAQVQVQAQAQVQVQVQAQAQVQGQGQAQVPAELMLAEQPAEAPSAASPPAAALPKSEIKAPATMTEAPTAPPPAAPAQAAQAPQPAATQTPAPLPAVPAQAAIEPAEGEGVAAEGAGTAEAATASVSEAPLPQLPQPTAAPALAPLPAKVAQPLEPELAEPAPAKADGQIGAATVATEEATFSGQREPAQLASRLPAEPRTTAEAIIPEAPRAEAAGRTPAPAPAQLVSPAPLRAEQAAMPNPAPDAYAAEPTVTARPGSIGHELGVEVARRIAAGKDELLVRLNPQEMGRIEVRMSFDEGGSLRAVVTADSPAALEMLRRDSADLGRTLADAGVRADSDSFRFASRGGDAGAQSGWQGRQDGGGDGRRHGQRHDGGDAWRAEPDAREPAYRPIRASGQVDLIA